MSLSVPCILLLFTLFVAFASTIPSAPVIYKVQSKDSILFLGGLNTVTGRTSPNGFINIFEREVKRSVGEVSVIHGGFAGADGSELLKKVDTMLTNHIMPTKAILTVGVDILAVESVHQLRSQMESIVARFLADDVEVILCPLLIDGERRDVPSELDDLSFELMQMSKQIARDYGIMLINLQPQLRNFWSQTNIDKLEHSVLTLDGRTLNDLGHMFVALQLLKALGVEHKTLQADNILLREQQRVAAVKEELAQLAKVDQTVEIRST